MTDRNWQPCTTSPRVLGIVRIGLGYTWLGVLAQKSDLVTYPQACWLPISLAHFLDGPPSLNFWALNYFLAIFAAICLTLGLASRMSGPITTVAGTTYLTLGMCFGKITHTENLLILATLCMSFTNWGQAFGLDARRCEKAKASPEIKSWGLWLTTLGLSLFYLGSALTKVTHGFLSSETIEYFLKLRILTSGDWLKPLTPWILTQTWLCSLGSWAAVIYESSFWIGLRSTSFRALAYCAALAFHSVLTVVAGMGFPTMKQVMLILLLAHILLFLGERRPKVARWLSVVTASPAGWKIQLASGLGTLILLFVSAFCFTGNNFGHLVPDFAFWLQKIAKTYANQAPGLLAVMAIGTACWIVWTDMVSRSNPKATMALDGGEV